MIRIGCSGWSYEHWRGLFYPQKGSTSRWLELYAESFDTVEINATFYRLPKATTVERWATRTPDHFLFTVKASRYLTHVKRLREIEEGVKRMEERIVPLRQTGKLGPILWQLPPHFTRDDDVAVQMRRIHTTVWRALARASSTERCEQERQRASGAA